MHSAYEDVWLLHLDLTEGLVNAIVAPVNDTTNLELVHV